MTYTDHNKIQMLNRFFIMFEKKMFVSMIASILLLIVLYAFLVFSSVTTAYALDEGKEELASITSRNSILESEFSIQKEKASENVGTRLVAVRDVSYLDSSFEQLVFNK